jgi:S1-C subfamily serine protease
VRVAAEPLEKSTVFFASRPAPAKGDSGAPVFDAQGRVVGMTQAIGSYADKPSFGTVGVHLRALVIRHFLASCAGGGPCGDD